MSAEKKGPALDLEAAAEAAVQLENEAKAEPDALTYIHTFKKPFEYMGRSIKELTFDWGALSGEDHQAIEDDMLRHGLTLVLPAYTGAFLNGMAVRACTDRDDNGIRIVTPELLKALPLRDYQQIYMSARRFLRRGES